MKLFNHTNKDAEKPKSTEQMQIDNLREDYDNLMNLFSSAQSLSEYLRVMEVAKDIDSVDYKQTLIKFNEVYTTFKSNKLDLKNKIKRFNNIYGHLPFTGVETAILNFISMQTGSSIHFDRCIAENNIRDID